MTQLLNPSSSYEMTVSQHYKFCTVNESIANPYVKRRSRRAFGSFQRFSEKVNFEPILTEHYADPYRPKAVCLNEFDSTVAVMRSERHIFLNEANVKSVPTVQFIKELEKISLEVVPSDVFNLQYDGEAFPDFAGVRIFDNYDVFGFEKLSDSDVAPIVIVDIPCIAKNANELYAHIARKIRIFGYEAQKPQLIKLSSKRAESGEELALLEFQFESRMSTFKFTLRDKLHHVTLASNFESIKKNGLVPRNGSKEFSYSERVYLFNSANDVDKLSYGSYACANKASGGPLDNMFCVFIVDAKKLQEEHPDIRFSVNRTFSSYVPGEDSDKIDDSALFTESPIPAKYISDDVFVFKHDASEKLHKIPDGKKISMRSTSATSLEELAKAFNSSS